MITARYWREIPQRYRLEGARCKKCGYIAFPPRLICPQCAGREFEPTKLAEEGAIETFTVIRVGPSNFGDETPYVVALIKLDDGAKLTAQVVDCDAAKLNVGDRVRREFRRLNADREDGVIFYGYKFVLVH
jgi:uncharacterized protein